MEGIQEKIDKLMSLSVRIENSTGVEINIDIDSVTDISGEKDYFYTLFLMSGKQSITILEDVEYETAYNYLKGILIGYQYAIEKHLRTICVN